MAVITVVASKGGVGKTTVSLLTALGLAERGRRVLLVDADRNAGITRWAERPGRPAGVRVAQAESASELVDMLKSVRKDGVGGRCDDVVVDTPGGLGRWGPVAARLAGVVLVPFTASPLDVWEALRTLEQLREAAVGSERDPVLAGALCRVPAAVRPRSLQAAVAQLKEAGLPMVATPLIEKEAFRAVFAHGGDLSALDARRVSGLETARSNQRAFVDSVSALARTKPTVELIAA